MSRKRNIQIIFWVSEEEREQIQAKMDQVGTENLSAYLRKIAIDGYILKLDLPELREMISLLRRSSNNLNQIARRLNETGRFYAADMEDKQHIINYSRTRQVFQEYKASGYSKKFLKEHQQEIEDHRATKRVFNELGLKKLPTVKSLNEEYSQVLAAKKSVYAQLRTAEAERRELLIHRENLRPILSPEEKPRGKRKEQDER